MSCGILPKKYEHANKKNASGLISNDHKLASMAIGFSDTIRCATQVTCVPNCAVRYDKLNLFMNAEHKVAVKSKASCSIHLR